jgi:60 kDa SS-A/Ro ribonucleoprotein
MNYAKHVSTVATPQSEPIPGTTQIPNSAGGHAWDADVWQKLDRFLVLGTEGGSYYAGERELTQKNAGNLETALKLDGLRTVARIAEISDAGRAPKNDPAIFALAMALKKGDEKTRKAARAAVPKVCRIGTHIFQLAEAVKHLGGWGRSTKGAFADWYLSQPFDALSMNVVKYQQRGGWSHRDLLRKSHAKPKTPEQNRLFRYAAGKPNEEPVGGIVGAFEAAKNIGAGVATMPGAAPTAPMVAAMARLISAEGLPRECVPTEFLNAPEVWDALLHAGKYGMPMTAMVRNLGKMSAIGLLKPLSDATKYVCDKLRNRDALKAARVHPVQLLLAQATYLQGHGDKGKLSWTVSEEIGAALADAFSLAFDFVEPTGKRHLLGLDVSASMDGSTVAGTPLTCRAASAAMAMVTARTEQRCHAVGFTSAGSRVYGGYGGMWGGGGTELTPIPQLNAKAELLSLINHVRAMPMGGTDCALPMIYAAKNNLEVDAFVILTDNETWAGSVHPSQALKAYRQKMGIDAKLVVVGMVANDFTIADPKDAGMLDVVGFDTAVPTVMSNFIRG